MHLLLVSNDLIRLNFIMSLLRDGGVHPILLDSHAASIEGSIGAIPRRLVVSDDDHAQATRILREAGLA